MYKKQSSQNNIISANSTTNLWTPQTVVFISLLFLPLSSKAGEAIPYSDAAVGNHRFIKLDKQGARIHESTTNTAVNWNCVFDRKTGLVWEVKTAKGLRGQENFYTWYNPDSRINGGFSGYRNGGKCQGSPCDTYSYIAVINKTALCGYQNWRLPSREELRSLVNYSIRPPKPMIDSHFFPHSAEQFYWSSTTDAADGDSAWGVGFALGYDYSYFKQGFGYIRLVTNYPQ